MKFLKFGKEMWDMSKTPPGVQLYTLRNEMQTDFFGTLQKVAGYKIVEFVSFLYKDIPVNEIKQAMDRLGLRTVSTYIGWEELESDLHHQIEYAEVLGVRYITTGFPEERFKDESSIQDVISSLKKIGKEARRSGIQLLYHPHAHEYKFVGSKRIIDQLLEGVGTDLLKLELDLYWAKKGGLDPLKALILYKDLSPLIHVKDMDKSGGFEDVGAGIINWPPIFRILKEVGVKNYFVERDTSPNPLESVKNSLDYLKSIKVA
ncbi:MAG TPA: sugar phosphate isomerase/epimerase family protein [Candidatus Udaeobacter sp.]|nr:sugar phosphate isomerase/epimerase family protein [Candidatus Udaeobacter sp.]